MTLRAKWTPRLAVALIAAAMLLAAFVIWMVLDPLKYKAIAFVEQGESGTALAAHVAALISPGQWIVLVLPFAMLLTGIVLEWRTGSLSLALRTLDGRQTLVLLIALLTWFGHSYLNAGYLLAGDTGSHVARTAHLRFGIDEGRLISWDNYFYIGETAMQFTGPLYFWLTAFVDYVIRNPNLTTKLTLFALHVCSGLAFFGLSRAVGLNRVAAIGATIVWSGSFAHLHLFLWEGAFPQALTTALLPFAIWMAELVLRDRRWFSGAWLALTLADAALIVAHQTTGAYLAIFIAVYTLASLMSGRAPWSRMAPLVLSATISICVASFAIVPIIVEKDWVMLYDSVSLPFRIEWPGADYFRRLISWSASDSRGTAATYVGISAIVLAGFGVWHASRSDDRIDFRFVRIMVLLLGLAFLLRGAHVRHMIAVLFVIAMLAGFGIQTIITRAASQRVALWLLAVLLVDLGPTAIQPLTRTDKGYFDEAGRFLVQQFPDDRVLVTNSRAHELQAEIGPGGTPLLYYRIQYLTGAHSLAATRSHNYLAATIKLVEADLRTYGKPGSTSTALLTMLNVGHIVNDTGKAMGLPDPLGEPTGEPLGRTIRLPSASPVVFAPKIKTLEPPVGLDKPVLWNEQFASDSTDPQARATLRFVRDVASAMEVNLETHVARFIPVRAPVSAEGGADAENAGWDGQIEQYHVGLEDVRLVLHSSRKGWIQIAHPFYQTVQVTRNGAGIAVYQGALNLLVLPVDAGQNDYAIRYRTSTLRKTMAWISTVTLGIATTLTAIAALRRRSWRHRNPQILLE
jgi:hypothetical protein